MTKQSTKAWMIKSSQYTNFRKDHSHILGIFFTFDEAYEFLKELIDSLTTSRKNDEAFVDYTLSTYWDEESNCDHGASIIYTPIVDGAKEICTDYAIESVPLYTDWTKILNRPVTIVKKLDISDTDVLKGA